MLSIVLVGAAVVLVTLVVLLSRRRSPEDVAPTSDERIELVDPRELLFSLPTIHDGLPAVEPSDRFAFEIAAALMREDDWRQAELLTVANRPFVDETLQRLVSHRAVHAHGTGFREVLVRGEPPTPLAAQRLVPGDVAAVAHTEQMPLYFAGSRPTRVRCAFAHQLPDVGFLYGLEEGGVVAALGVAVVSSGRGDVEPLAELSRRHALLFVDWVHGIVVEPGDAAGFREWLQAVVRVEGGPEE